MKIFGHRGVRKKDDSSSPYQNTIEAIELAFAEEADGIEIDVMLSSDATLYLIHDDDLSLHTTSAGFLSKLANQQVSAVKTKGGFAIPTLENVLKLLTEKYPDKEINIELKGASTAIPVCELVNKIGFNKDKLSVSSFEHSQLHEVQKFDDEIKIGLLIEKKMLEENSIFELIEPFQNYNSFYSLNIEDVLVPEIKKAELHLEKKIYVWSMSDGKPTSSYVKNLQEEKIDCLMTDYPSIARSEMIDIGASS